METDSNRSSTNQNLTDGLKIKSHSGKIYTLRQYEKKSYIDRKGEEKELIVFNVQNSNKKKIGTITQYTTQERLESLIERYENPNHMKPFEIIARIGNNNGFPYVLLSEPVRAWNNVLIDDEVLIEIENEKGQIITDICHNVSKIGTAKTNNTKSGGSYNVNLSRMRRFYIDNDGKQAILSTSEFKQDKSKAFLHDGMLVKVRVSPDSENQNFFLADSMIEDVNRLLKRSKEDD